MSRKPILAPEALQDLFDIQRYLRSKASVEIARHVEKKIKKSIEFLGRIPGAGHFREDLGSNSLKFWPVFSYLIVYDP